VEVGADLVVDAVSQSAEGTTREEAGERVDWWLEEGGDE
jgi:SET domain-containing protein 6